MNANNTRTIPAPALDRPTIPAPPSAHDLVEACRPDLRLPSDALAQAALAVVRDGLPNSYPRFKVGVDGLARAQTLPPRDAVEAEVDAMFAELEGEL